MEAWSCACGSEPVVVISCGKEEHATGAPGVAIVGLSTYELLHDGDFSSTRISVILRYNLKKSKTV